jgi:hypothetical protein
MKISDMAVLGNGVYELEKGWFSDWKLCTNNMAKLRLGGIVTGSRFQKPNGHTNL